MYCLTCECEFDGWTGKCPSCKNHFQGGKHPVQSSNQQQVNYDSLVDIVKERGGTLNIQLKASEVGKTRATRFPWRGYGNAWTKRMQGAREGASVDLSTTKVAKDKKWSFPYQGHGCAWRQELQGSIGGNEVTLTAKKVTRKKTWSFSYFGYSYAWTEEMSGECGREPLIELKTTKVKKNRRKLFPYFGFGYAWVKEGELSLSLT